MVMRILINAIGVTRRKAGVGVYAKSLTDWLVSNDKLHLFVLAQDDDSDFDYQGLPNVTVLWVPSSLLRTPLIRLIFEQLVLPFILWKHDIDVVHSLHYSFPLVSGRAKNVVTIHDMTSFSMPEVHLTSKRLYYRAFIRAAARFADALIFVSQSAQNDLIARFGPPKGISAVIHHGKDDSFSPCRDQELLQQVRNKYGLPSRFILYVGTIEPRKNLVRLVEAFSQIADLHPDTALVIAGAKGWMYDSLFECVRCLRLEARIFFPGFVAEEDKRLLICAADVFAYISLYEGFGLPVLEALACGVPTLTSNTSSLPEVAGVAALAVDPSDVEQIAFSLNCLLSDSVLRQELNKASLLQAARFTWQKTAAGTIRVYQDTLDHPIVELA
jgi:glycosyltransferase involved in cell wall biosynthesis